MRSLPFIVLITGLSLAAIGVNAADRTGVTQTNPIPLRLTPDELADVYVSPGKPTLLRFKTGAQVRYTPSEALKIDEVKDPSTNDTVLFVTAIVDGGVHRLILSHEGLDYVLLVHIGKADRAGKSLVQYTRTFRFGATDAAELNTNLQRLGSAPRLPTDKLDIKRILPRIEHAKRDPVYRRELRGYEEFKIGYPYSWNGCYVWLRAVHEFYEEDLCVIEIDWLNKTSEAIYLDCGQIGLRVAGHDMPVRVATQRSINAVVLPGEQDTIYLIMQGDRVAPQNKFELVLPPDADLIRERMGR